MSFISYQFIRIQEKKIFYHENITNQELVIDKVLQLNRLRNEQMLNDNSGWDDMIDFAAKPDADWAIDNVDFFVTSFKLSLVLVYNKDKSLVHQFGDVAFPKGSSFPDREMIESLFSKHPFTHYFQYLGNDLFEIFGATIVPSSDSNDRKTTPQGYLFIGQKWNTKYVAEHAEATNYKTALFSIDDFKSFRKDSEKIYFIKDLTDNTGKPVAKLVFSKEDPLQDDLAPFLNLSILIAIIALLTMAVFLYSFRRIVLLPLSEIAATLNTHDVSHIGPLSRRNDEFKDLGALIEQFFLQEEILRQNNLELSENNAMKDRLFSIIAHDLKNPVGNILSMSEILSNNFQKMDEETLTELVGLVGNQAKETMNLLKTLFTWAKSQSGQITFNPRLLDLDQVVESVLENLSSSALLKEIIIFKPDVKNVKVYADANMLSTILRNLITNSIKYTNVGGSIRISAQTNARETEISVVDTGVGIDSKMQEKLFKVESNFTTSGTANEKGTGLGLVICKEFIKKHGGQISVVSELGKGSQFILTFPFEESKQQLS